MVEYLKAIYNVLFVFKDYQPQKVTLIAFHKWLSQFRFKDQKAILHLFNSLIYYDEKETKRILFKLNAELTQILLSDSKLDPSKIIYATFSTPGSSSHVMLNYLRDLANLERKGFKLIDISNAKVLSDITNKLGEGVIIYVDDFAGSGKQFEDNRNFAASFIQGNFSEYFLAPVICIEAKLKFDKMGVESVSSQIHDFEERPLHSKSSKFLLSEKLRLIQICMEINRGAGLGYDKMAAMTIFYRNSPNNTPLIFRGNLKQKPIRGIFPRADDLPF